MEFIDCEADDKCFLEDEDLRRMELEELQHQTEFRDDENIANKDPSLYRLANVTRSCSDAEMDPFYNQVIKRY